LNAYCLITTFYEQHTEKQRSKLKHTSINKIKLQSHSSHIWPLYWADVSSPHQLRLANSWSYHIWPSGFLSASCRFGNHCLTT